MKHRCDPGWSDLIEEEILCDQGTELCIFVCAYIGIWTSDWIKVKKDRLILTAVSFWVPKFMKNNVF